MDKTNLDFHQPTEREYSITHSNDFILQVDNFLDKDEANGFVDLFYYMKGMGLTATRQKGEGISKSLKQDEATSIHNSIQTIDATNKFTEEYNLTHDGTNFIAETTNRMWDVYRLYESQFMVKEHNSLTNPAIKIQKTEPSEGYHVWHTEIEAGFPQSYHRHVAWTVYLNDIEEGGETEFLHQKFRVKPKTGRLAMWPAGFTHVHRGNPPLTETKFILTGWINR